MAHVAAQDKGLFPHKMKIIPQLSLSTKQQKLMGQTLAYAFPGMMW